MKLKHRHNIGIILLCGLLGLVACSKEALKLPYDKEEGEDNSVFLTFYTGVTGISSRAGEGESASDEQIKQLLIVIVSEKADTRESTDGETGSEVAKKWVVEHNCLVKGASIGLPLTNGYKFKVDAGCRKRIYLIANHANLKDAKGKSFDLTDPAFIPAQDGKAPVDDYVFTPGYNPESDGIPMTAMYEITIPDRKEITNDDYELTDPLYLVRAATKFSFNFTNNSALRAITVTGIDIERVITDRMYLLPQVNKNDDGKYWVVDNNGTAHPLPLSDTQTSEVTNKQWIDWMVTETGKASDADSYQWLTAYNVPYATIGKAQVSGTKFPLKISENTTQSLTNAIYLPESKTVNSGASHEMQEYSVTIHAKESDYSVNSTAYTATLPHLYSLFRNTHVKVNVSFKDNELEWQVDVIPYSEVVLDPIFGLDKKTTD